MKKAYALLILLAIILKVNAQGVWKSRQSFTQQYYPTAASFVINDRAYIGLGRATTSLQAFDPASGAWMSKAAFTGDERIGPASFSIENKGYIIGGAEPYGGPVKRDTWEYDPVSNTWSQKADLPGKERYGAAAFAIDGKGYTTWGADTHHGNLNDVWAYDPRNNEWERKNDFPSTGRAYGFSVASGNKAYIGTGWDGKENTMCWEYDPVTDRWKEIADFPGEGRFGVSAFYLDGRLYAGGGFSPAAQKICADFYAYDPATDEWNEAASLPEAFHGGVGFSMNGKGYAGFGTSTVLYEYEPSSMSAFQHDTNRDIKLNVWPNPSQGVFRIELDGPEREKALLEVFDCSGKMVIGKKSFASSDVLDLSSLDAGIYYLKLECGSQQCIERLVVMH
jgi:N-acetylneuraminic acid mutarotase